MIRFKTDYFSTSKKFQTRVYNVVNFIKFKQILVITKLLEQIFKQNLCEKNTTFRNHKICMEQIFKQNLCEKNTTFCKHLVKNELTKFDAFSYATIILS